MCLCTEVLLILSTAKGSARCLAVNHWKLLSECRFQTDLCHDFSQSSAALMNVVWDNVRSLGDIEIRSSGLKLLWVCAVRALWAMKTVAEAITEALVTTLEALGRQARSLSTIERDLVQQQAPLLASDVSKILPAVQSRGAGTRWQTSGARHVGGLRRHQATEGDEDTRMLSSSEAVPGEELSPRRAPSIWRGILIHQQGQSILRVHAAPNDTRLLWSAPASVFRGILKFHGNNMRTII
ncbi:uncharacterized protein LOC116962264 [Tyto alba]|uniref:uncharacterized protein LOC116962264 n=1 Tax=Tyto alba TaxID=56313 RepID=UPI001C682835|nr:uncharacterized protein LOC116962264 [Tyto alba]